MSALDFRGWINSLEQDNKLLKVGVDVDTLDDMGAFISRCDYRGIDTPILFEQPKDFDIPVLAHRFIPDRDLLIILNVCSFMGVDCTVPLGLRNKVMKRVLTVPEIEARVDGLWANVFSAK